MDFFLNRSKKNGMTVEVTRVMSSNIMGYAFVGRARRTLIEKQ